MMILPKLTIWLVHVPRKRSLSFSLTGIGIASGEVWKRQRKFTFNIFRNLGLGKSSFESIIVKECQKLATEITRQDKDAFNPLIPFSNATSNVICSFAFGIRYEYTNSKFKFLFIVYVIKPGNIACLCANFGYQITILSVFFSSSTTLINPQDVL